EKMESWVSGVVGEEEPAGPCEALPEFHQTGGWWLSRDVAVVWDANPHETLFYRAGSEGCCDLLVDIRQAVWDAAACSRQAQSFDNALRAKCSVPEVYDHIVACEAMRTCQCLKALLRGEPLALAVQQVSVAAAWGEPSR
ncbi:MAG: hypothetical protein GY772_16010, partial [bacterium]|nr:hypothetical protein [bacterium]